MFDPSIPRDTLDVDSTPIRVTPEYRPERGICSNDFARLYRDMQRGVLFSNDHVPWWERFSV